MSIHIEASDRQGVELSEQSVMFSTSRLTTAMLSQAGLTNQQCLVFAHRHNMELSRKRAPDAVNTRSSSQTSSPLLLSQFFSSALLHLSTQIEYNCVSFLPCSKTISMHTSLILIKNDDACVNACKWVTCIIFPSCHYSDPMPTPCSLQLSRCQLVNTNFESASVITMEFDNFLKTLVVEGQS